MGRGPGISACGAQGTSPEHRRRLWDVCVPSRVRGHHEAAGDFRVFFGGGGPPLPSLVFFRRSHFYRGRVHTFTELRIVSSEFGLFTLLPNSEL
jgi:hypothetical protein